jgi:hypothetical protein
MTHVTREIDNVYYITSRAAYIVYTDKTLCIYPYK